MPDYKSMYYALLRAQTKAINALESAHLNAEKQFMDAKDPVELADSREENKNDSDKCT